MLVAVKQAGLALEYASEGLRADREIVLAAVAVRGIALKHAPEELRRLQEAAVDAFAAARPLPTSAEKGDLFVVHDTGAHSHSMGFQYNCTPRAPELLERPDGSVDVIRTRETAEDLFANTL